MPNATQIKNLEKGKKTQFRGETAVENQRKATESRKRNIALREAVKVAMACLPEEVLSDKQLKALHREGVDTDGKSSVEVVAASLAVKAMRGNTKAVEVLMELLGESTSAERNRIERERLALERVKMERDKTAQQTEDRIQITILPSGGIEVDDGESDG
jgi:hypothetical protein